MRVFKDLTRVIVTALLGAILLFGGGQQVVYAEDQPEYRIQVSPAHLNLDLHPGTTATAKFKVQNTGTKSFDYELSTGPYNVVGENYSQDITKVTDYNYIKDWVTFSEQKGSLAAGAEKEITVTVNVPKDSPSGGQYCAIFARMKEPDTGAGGVQAEKQVGVLVYSKNIDGKTREEGKVVENKVPSFLFAPPIQATSVVENTGNIHVEAKYILQVFPLFGNEEVYTNEEDPETRLILPETRRFNTITWDGAPQLGIFKVRQTVEFLGEKSVTEKVVFLCPIWFLLIILVLVFLAVFWIVSRSRGRKED